MLLPTSFTDATTTPLPTATRCDIFCRVIDNYGDIGVCWRLARQLANEYSLSVRLWVDDLTALVKIWPAASILEQQWLAGVEVCLWSEAWQTTEPAHWVIEAFACELPNDYLLAMKQQQTAPLWFNLEYLSAEDWVEDCHGLESMHPSLGLKKIFFFPGFSQRTGGLIRERGLLAKRDQFISHHQQESFFAQLGIRIPSEHFIVSLFGYHNLSVASLLDCWINSPTPITCLLPNNTILAAVEQYWGSQLNEGETYTQGALSLWVLPFLAQEDFDQLLWACDLNFVRGEDSFVRAQWAGKPLVWQIYPQADNAHLIKLTAFLAHYCDGLPAELKQAINALWHAWNQGQDCTLAWNQCLSHYALWYKHSDNWTQKLNSFGDLAGKLVQFCGKTL